jgi:hypothetical protein
VHANRPVHRPSGENGDHNYIPKGARCAADSDGANPLSNEPSVISVITTSIRELGSHGPQNFADPPPLTDGPATPAIPASAAEGPQAGAAERHEISEI